MHPLALVGLGGALGSMLRYWLGGLAQHRLDATGFPVGTLLVNVAGCLLIGVLSGAVDARHAFPPEARLLIGAGVLGGFTTFSALGNETINLLRAGSTGLAALNVGANVLAGLVAAWLGRSATATLLR